MKYLKSILRDSGIYGLSDLVTKVLSFFTFPIIASTVSPSAFGVFDLITTVIALLGMIINCGINNAVFRFYWEGGVNQNTQNKVVTSGFVAQLSIGSILLLIGLICVPFVLPVTQSSGWPITWISLISALLITQISQLIQFSIDVLRLHLAPWRFFILALLSRVLTISLAVLAVVKFDFGIDGLLASQAIVLIVVIPIAIAMIRKDLRLRYFDMKWMLEIIKFGYPYIFTGLAFWLFGSMDRWMLSSMSSLEEAGIFSVANRFASVVFFVSTAFGQAWSPLAMKIKAEQPNKYKEIYGNMLLFILYMMLVIGGGVALFSAEVISVILPKQYISSILPLIILCFGIILQATIQITAIGISLEKKTYLFARLSWISAGINFAVNWILIPKYGAVGAACATLFSYLFLTCSYLFFTQKLHPILIPWRIIFMLVLLAMVIACLSIFMSSKTINLFFVSTKIIILLIMILVGFNFAKKSQILNSSE